MIIPFFIPHSGCPHQCVFCNQKNITGQTSPVDRSEIPVKISEYVKSNAKQDPVQVAFYGGSFTALPWARQKPYLEAVRPFILSGQIENIRISTRPDCIENDNLALLKAYHVNTVELGAQSMDDTVLSLSSRGHTSSDTQHGVQLLKARGFLVGLQLMPGLPGDRPDLFMDTVEKVIDLQPDFVRIYPALVIKNTPLEHLYQSRQYLPLTLDSAIALCRKALLRFEQAQIDVIRVGLQPTEELNRPGTVLAGPCHPAFRQLVESSILLDKMRSLLLDSKPGSGTVVFQVNPKDLSAAIGQRRSNIVHLKQEFGLNDILIKEGNNILRRGKPTLLSVF